MSDNNENIILPDTDLELRALTTAPKWKELLNNKYFLSCLATTKPVFIPKGKEILVNGEKVVYNEDVTYYDQDNALAVVGMVTQDLRLSNLTKTDILYIEKNLELASNCIRHGIRPATIFLLRAIFRLELMQSHKGFLRNLERTITQKQERTLTEAKPKGFFFSGKKQ